MQMRVGITERGDAALDHRWVPWVQAGNPAVLLSKDPGKLFEKLEEIVPPLDKLVVHATVTGMGGTKIEPGVPHPKEALEGAFRLVEMFVEADLPSDHVVLRVDPIVPTPKGTEMALLIIRKYSEELAKSKLVPRIRISFIDAYPHVRARLRSVDVDLPWEGLHAPRDVRLSTLRTIQSHCLKDPEICGEPDMACIGCISKIDMELFGIQDYLRSTSSQRKYCNCLSAKYELLATKAQCPHLCKYCYWKG